MIKDRKKLNLGFSLVEVLVVIAIFGSLAVFSLTGINKKRSDNVLENAQASLLIALEKARSHSQAGIGTNGYGVSIENTTFTIFEVGTTTKNITTDFNRLISATPTPITIEFKRIKGTATSTKAFPISIIIENKLNKATTTINIFEDGRITTP